MIGWITKRAELLLVVADDDEFARVPYRGHRTGKAARLARQGSAIVAAVGIAAFDTVDIPFPCTDAMLSGIDERVIHIEPITADSTVRAGVGQRTLGDAQPSALPSVPSLESCA